MKQFPRYLLLILTTITLAGWIWSYWRAERVGYSNQRSSTVIGLNYGRAFFTTAQFNDTEGIFTNRSPGWKYIRSNSVPTDDISPSSDRHEFPGIVYVEDSSPQIALHYIAIRFWLISLLFTLITLLLWYPKIKAWRQGTSRKGFEVEIREKVKEQ